MTCQEKLSFLLLQNTCVGVICLYEVNSQLFFNRIIPPVGGGGHEQRVRTENG